MLSRDGHFFWNVLCRFRPFKRATTNKKSSFSASSSVFTVREKEAERKARYWQSGSSLNAEKFEDCEELVLTQDVLAATSHDWLPDAWLRLTTLTCQWVIVLIRASCRRVHTRQHGIGVCVCLCTLERVVSSKPLKGSEFWLTIDLRSNKESFSVCNHRVQWDFFQGMLECF